MHSIMDLNYGSPLSLQRLTSPGDFLQLRRYMIKVSEQDQTCIHIVRCLHQAKLIVSELRVFANTVWAPLSHADDVEYGSFAGPRFVEQIDIYVEKTFARFTKIYFILCGVLFRLNNRSSRISHFRLRSFSEDLQDDWQTMLNIRDSLAKHIQECFSKQNDLIRDAQ
ncbi:hypothetical protein BCR43DRAFT_490397 [Syncephalastrum racemosum]|uniref:Uncharacterized protein n=1 Tax=Syncephalastrum racemosum TaxID=13706 RepID=A0A1X2HFX6_SYNRA|nr:hypothetical protein BCR43DRAFT_490397 [Syncephalastrum racemosum]